MKKEFKNIIKEHKGILYKIARSYTLSPSDFEDLYQEMLIQIWQSLKSFKKDSKLSTWIYRVCLNTALSYKRNSSKIKIKDSANDWFFIKDSSGDNLNEKIEQDSKIELLYQCINLLPEVNRAIILLYLDKKKYEEIAEILGMKTTHIGVKISRIKKELYKLLLENDYERI